MHALIKLAIQARIKRFKTQVSTLAMARIRSNHITPGANMRKRSLDVAPKVQRLR